MRIYIAIATGGVFGCWARYIMTNLMVAVYGHDFPFATLAINLLGAFVMGFLFIETLERLNISPILRTGILTGGLGGFTTFSTYQLESITMMAQGEPFKAVLYIGLSLVLGYLCAFGGAYIARNL
jgi:CrcB protein